MPHDNQADRSAQVVAVRAPSLSRALEAVLRFEDPDALKEFFPQARFTEEEKEAIRRRGRALRKRLEALVLGAPLPELPPPPSFESSRSGHLAGSNGHARATLAGFSDFMQDYGALVVPLVTGGLTELGVKIPTFVTTALNNYVTSITLQKPTAPTSQAPGGSELNAEAVEQVAYGIALALAVAVNTGRQAQANAIVQATRGLDPTIVARVEALLPRADGEVKTAGPQNVVALMTRAVGQLSAVEGMMRASGIDTTPVAAISTAANSVLKELSASVTREVVGAGKSDAMVLAGGVGEATGGAIALDAADLPSGTSELLVPLLIGGVAAAGVAVAAIALS